MTVNIELEFRSAYLFRTRSVATNPVTSLGFKPIPCATMLCHFDQTRNGSVAIHFIFRGSAATSSATGDYVAIPARFGRNGELASSNKEGIGKSLVLFPQVYLIDAMKSHKNL